MAAAAIRLGTPSLARMCVTWTLAVFREMNRTSAISPFVRAAATSSRTWISRAERPSSARRRRPGSEPARHGGRCAGARRPGSPRPEALRRAARREPRRCRPVPGGQAPRSPSASGTAPSLSAAAAASRRSAAAAARSERPPSSGLGSTPTGIGGGGRPQLGPGSNKVRSTPRGRGRRPRDLARPAPTPSSPRSRASSAPGRPVRGPPARPAAPTAAPRPRAPRTRASPSPQARAASARSAAFRQPSASRGAARKTSSLPSRSARPLPDGGGGTGPARSAQHQSSAAAVWR